MFKVVDLHDTMFENRSFSQNSGYFGYSIYYKSSRKEEHCREKFKSWNPNGFKKIPSLDIRLTTNPKR